MNSGLLLLVMLTMIILLVVGRRAHALPRAPVGLRGVAPIPRSATPGIARATSALDREESDDTTRAATVRVYDPSGRQTAEADLQRTRLREPYHRAPSLRTSIVVMEILGPPRAVRESTPPFF